MQDVLGEVDAGIRVIIGEFAEGAARANMEWVRAIEARHVDPELAMKHLTSVTVFLEAILPYQVEDILKAAHSALDALESATEPPRERD